MEDSNGNSFNGTGGFGFWDVTNEVSRSFPLLMQYACPGYQFRNN